MEPHPLGGGDSPLRIPTSSPASPRSTADSKFIDAMDKAYWQTAALLYDPDEHLFYRDNRFLSMKSKTQSLLSRGDGWVLGGLTNILSFMPDNYPFAQNTNSSSKTWPTKSSPSRKTTAYGPPLPRPRPRHKNRNLRLRLLHLRLLEGNQPPSPRQRQIPRRNANWLDRPHLPTPPRRPARLRPTHRLQTRRLQAITLDNTQYYGNAPPPRRLRNPQIQTLPAAPAGAK